MALKFGQVLDMDPVYWLNLQMIYELDLAKIKQSKLNKRLSKLRKAS
jgi:plasmid maintenance system antidote protein VapI